MIDHAKKLIFIHITRTGGTSIESAISGKDWWLIDPNSKHLSASMTKILYGEDVWNSYFKFSIVRNPWDRMVSMYATGWWFEGDLGENKTYPTMAEFILKNRPHETEKHGHKFYHEILDEELDFIGRYENLENDFQLICSKTGLVGIDFPHEEIRYREHYSAYFDDEATSLLQQIYATDIEKYGYSFERKVLFDPTAVLRLQSISQQKKHYSDIREWAERSEAALAMEREASQQLREWAERSDSALLKEQENSKQMQKWAERTEGFLKVEREDSEKLRHLVEDANAVIIQERKASQQLREWAERSDSALLKEQENSKQMQEWAEREENLLVAEKLLVQELQQSNNKLSYEIIHLREFTSLFCWIYKFFRKIRKYND